MTVEDKIVEIENNLRAVPEYRFQDYHEQFHSMCAEYVTLEGLWMEFGVFTGRSLEQFSRKAPIIYGFDGFSGLPEHWDSNNPKNCYSLGGKIPAGYIVGPNHSMFDSRHPTNIAPWPENVRLVQGFFDDTLPKFLEKTEGDAAFIHIDSDLYSSAKTVLTNLKSRIKKGTVILFDEILGYEDYKLHEIKAFAEFLLDTGLSYKAVISQHLNNYGQGLFIIE